MRAANLAFKLDNWAEIWLKSCILHRLLSEPDKRLSTRRLSELSCRRDAYPRAQQRARGGQASGHARQPQASDFPPGGCGDRSVVSKQQRPRASPVQLAQRMNYLTGDKKLMGMEATARIPLPIRT